MYDDRWYCPTGERTLTATAPSHAMPITTRWDCVDALVNEHKGDDDVTEWITKGFYNI
jgi:hypothetical protein